MNIKQLINFTKMPSSTEDSLGQLKLLINQIVCYIPGSVLPALLMLVFTMLFTRIYGAAAYGKYSLVLSIALFVVAISSQWLQQSTNRYLPGQNDVNNINSLKRTVILGIIVIISFIVLLSLIFAPFGFFFVSSDWHAFYLPAILICIGMSVFNILGVVLQAEMKAKIYSTYKFWEAFLKLCIALLVTFFITEHASSMVWGVALSVVLLIPFMLRSADMPVFLTDGRQIKDDFIMLKNFAAYGFPMIGWFMCSTFLNVGDRYIIQLFRGSSEVGLYSANYQLIQGAIMICTMPVLLAAHPFLMKSWGQINKEETQKWLSTIIGWFLIIGILLIGGTAILSYDFANWFLGVEFRQGHIIMPIVLAGLICWQLGMYAHKPLEFTKQTNIMLKISIYSVLLNLLLNIIFVPLYGYIGAAYTTFFSFLLYLIMVVIKGRKIIKWKIDQKYIVLFVIILVFSFIIEMLRGYIESMLGYWFGIIFVVLSFLVLGVLVLGQQILAWRK